MLPRMSIPRALAALALLSIGALVVTTPACVRDNDQENGQTCLKDEDCASHHCISNTCLQDIVDPYCNGGACPDVGGEAPATDSASDSPSEAEAAADAPAESSADTAADAAETD